MSRIDFWVSRWPVVIAAAMLMLGVPGCVGLAAQIMYVIHGDKVEAEYEGLEEKRVAVVCVANRSAYGSGGEADALARMVAVLLQKEIKDIEIVSHTEINNWKDTADWDEIDYRAVGRGVKAQRLIAIDVKSLSYYDGQTLYKGSADLTVTVYDMEKGGTIAWSKDMPDFQFPQHGGRPVTDMVESKFQKDFLSILAKDIGRCFYPYDRIEKVGLDAQLLD